MIVDLNNLLNPNKKIKKLYWT